MTQNVKEKMLLLQRKFGFLERDLCAFQSSIIITDALLLPHLVETELLSLLGIWLDRQTEKKPRNHVDPDHMGTITPKCLFS